MQIEFSDKQANAFLTNLGYTIIYHIYQEEYTPLKSIYLAYKGEIPIKMKDIIERKYISESDILWGLRDNLMENVFNNEMTNFLINLKQL
jgi:hypothetical protein